MKSCNMLHVPFSIPRRLRTGLKEVQRDILWLVRKEENASSKLGNHLQG